MKYNVSTFRKSGLEARWTRTRQNAPIIAVRKSGSGHWYVVDKNLWKDMQKEGVIQAFEQHTLLGDYFSIPA